MFEEKLNEKIQDRQIFVLDSTTPIKFSKHVIVHSQKLFPGNQSLKPLVDELCRKMQESGVGRITNDRNEPDLIVDSGVYGKRRNFRMYLSTKYNKSAMLDFEKLCYNFGMQKIFCLFL